jgi:hypothetical protein
MHTQSSRPDEALLELIARLIARRHIERHRAASDASSPDQPMLCTLVESQPQSRACVKAARD